MRPKNLLYGFAGKHFGIFPPLLFDAFSITVISDVTKPAARSMSFSQWNAGHVV